MVKESQEKPESFRSDLPQSVQLCLSLPKGKFCRPSKMCICCSYDLRFPEVYQELTFNRGAQILLVPSAFTKLTGEGPDVDS